MMVLWATWENKILLGRYISLYLSRLEGHDLYNWVNPAESVSDILNLYEEKEIQTEMLKSKKEMQSKFDKILAYYVAG